MPTAELKVDSTSSPPPSKTPKMSRQSIALSVLLFVITVLPYLQVIRHDFFNLDDPTYVIQNRMVTDGVTAQGMTWAFTTFYGSNWHPLTWLSHMLDCQLFGVKPAGHHAINLFLHALNVVLLFLVFKRLSGLLWPSAFVAALFALHPVHVESVAWIAERKDVLSTFFGLLCILAYIPYARSAIVDRRSRLTSYSLTLVLFAMSLMAKPMLVTLPFVFMLLDYWPLKRFEYRTVSDWSRSLLEKLPFLALSLASSTLTLIAQRRGGAVASLDMLPVGTRINSVIMAYLSYLGKAFWPNPLSMFYPYQRTWNSWLVAAAVLALVAISILALRNARSRPYFIVGWFWFLGTLVPVIGLVQVGAQAIADRYTYVPLIGIFIIIAWGVRDLTNRSTMARQGACILALCLLGALGGLTFVQVSYWKNTESLCRHALKVTKGNFLAHATLGAALLDDGHVPEAKEQFASALEIDPGHFGSLFGLGKALLGEGKDDQAADLFRQTLKFAPRHAVAHYLLGSVLAKQDKTDEAMLHFEEAIKSNPFFLSPYADLASLQISRGQAAAGMSNALAALRLDPYSPDAHFNVAAALLLQGKLQEALPHYEVALKGRPDFAEAHLDYGKALLNLGKLEQAESELIRAVQLNAADIEAHRYLAQLYSKQKRPQQQLQEYAQLLRLQPDWPEVLNNLAWLQATHPSDDLRAGSEAVALARRACELTSHTNLWFLSTLAAAYAEAGDFPQAITTQEKVCQMAESQLTNTPAQPFLSRLDLYKSHHAYHEP